MTDFDLAGFLPYRIAVFAKRISTGFAERYGRRFGLSVPDWRVLAHLSQIDAINLGEIPEKVDLDRSQVSRSIAELEEKGLVVKQDEFGDELLAAVSLTPRGEEIIAELKPLALAYEREVVATLSETDRSSLFRILGHLLNGQRSILLFDDQQSLASYRLRIALNVLGINYRSEAVAPTGDDGHPSENISRRSNDPSPLLDINGSVFTESIATIEYLNETCSGDLLPIDPVARARVRALAHAMVLARCPVSYLSSDDATVEALTERTSVSDRIQDFFSRDLTAIEAMLDHPATGRFCQGDVISLADVCLVPQIYEAKRCSVDLASFPRISRIVDQLSGIEAVRAAYPGE